MEIVADDLKRYLGALEVEEKQAWAHLNQNLGRQQFCHEMIARLEAPALQPAPVPAPTDNDKPAMELVEALKEG